MTLTDEQLVARAQQGDTDAADAVCRRYERMAYAIASPFSTHLTDSADMRQEAFHGLYAAVRYYRPGQGTTFGSFARVCITRWLFTVIKTDRVQKRLADEVPLSLDADLAGDDNEGLRFLRDAVPDPRALDPFDALVAQQAMRMLLDAVAYHLTPTERSCIVALARGDSYDEISADTGFAWKAVDNAIQRARKKLASLRDAA